MQTQTETTPTPKQKATPPQRPPTLERVTIRSLPKVAFLYPTLIAAGAAALGSRLELGSATLWGHFFLIVFCLNLVVISFEFPRTTSLTFFFLIVAVVFGAILINQRQEFFPWLEERGRGLDPTASTEFYTVISVMLFTIFILVAIIHRWFDYWEVLSNELIHHHGILGSLERLPAPGITLEKEITDVFEFMLLGAGRLVITPASAGRTIVLENVPRIERVERQIKAVLSVTEVEVHTR